MEQGLGDPWWGPAMEPISPALQAGSLNHWTTREAPPKLIGYYLFSSVVTQLCLTLWDPLDCSTPGCPVPHQLPESTQPHAHWVGDAIQPSHLCHSLLLPPQSFPTSGSFLMSQFFTSGGLSIRVSASASVLPKNTQDWSPLGWTGWIS